MARTIKEDDISSLDDMLDKVKHLEAAQKMFLEMKNRHQILVAIPELYALIDECNPDNFSRIKSEFVSKYNGVVHFAMPDIDMRANN